MTLRSKPNDSVIRFIGSTASISVTNFILLGSIYYNFGVNLFSAISFMFLLASFSFGILNGTVLTTLQVLTESSNYRARIFYDHLKILYILLFIFFISSLLFIYQFTLNILYAFLLANCLSLFAARWFSRASFLISKKYHEAFKLDRNMSLSTLLCVLASFYTSELQFVIFFAVFTFFQLVFSIDIIKFIPRDLIITKDNLFFGEFKKNGKFSLLGVLCTEVTSNFFMYFTAFAHGQKSFAILSMCMMCYRPIQLVISSVTSSERPNIGGLVKQGGLKNRANYLGKILIVALLLNLSAIFVFIFINQHYGFISELVSVDVFYIISILFLIYLIKTFRVFPVLVLQYNQKYDFLFKLTLFSAFITLTLTLLGAYFFKESYIFSTIAVLVGEVLILAGVIKRAKTNV